MTTPRMSHAVAVMAALILINASSAIAAPLPKSTGYFARGFAAYVDPSEEGIDGGIGLFAQLGANFGSGEAMAEIGHIRLDQEETFEIDEYLVDATAELSVTSVMVGGRFGIPLGSDRVRLMAGGAVGFAYVGLSVDVSGDLVGSADEGETSACWAGDVGLAVSLSEKLELSVGYRYMMVKGTEWDVEGVTVDMPDIDGNLYYAGLAYRW